eukprot:CAMPEP_0197826482 /NCGR_PEP_ID=MMETSP1437-20131217/3439_1 /TAXON_ID=49252 ORGANISM="Eucampia antarctica, Strain CCMP1452" /NCGR_SAMPLE_ID=MMETSP1437 /ASSEMBLY_ACC=CAM_ASM_001096 /LENGTH=464 /DNA_ID=CAMNT_0043426951 /DNA_START=257 /DNA_END=1651 /DNA_ORIENTATION=+
MSTEEESDDDALSKLIGKRGGIVKKRADTPKAPVIPPDDLPELKEPLSDKTGMDVFEMPDFKVKRPLRSANKGDDNNSDSEGSNDKDELFIDYQAEYEDENDLHIPNRIGFGTMAWGNPDSGFKIGKKLKKKEKKRGKFLAGDLQVAYNKLTEAGITLVDTSENYGLSSRKEKLSAEEIIGTILEGNTETSPLITSTMSNPWTSLRQGTGLRIGRKSAILKVIEQSCERMGTSVIDLYQVPSKMFYLGTPGVVADALCMAMDQGLINNVGVCNMGKTSMKNFAQKLKKRGYDLTSNQFEFSLTNRKASKSGLIQACKQLGVIPIAHTPLGGGLATGIYTATNPTGGLQSAIAPFDFKTLDKFSTLHGMMETVTSRVGTRLEKEKNANQDRYKARFRGAPEVNTSATTAQIAINYVVAKGCVPVPGINNPKEAEELLGCLGWSLTDKEVKMLDDAADASESGVRV